MRSRRAEDRGTERAEEGDLDELCTVGLFNAGIDVPLIDRVVIRRDGLLFLCATKKGVLVELDRLYLRIADRQPAETAFVLT